MFQLTWNRCHFLCFLTAIYICTHFFCCVMAHEDFYKILGVERSASQRDIKRAFRKLALKYHPDKNREENASDMFQKITKAYNVLGDPAKKKGYDMTGRVSDEGFENIDMSSFFTKFDDIIKGFSQIPLDQNQEQKNFQGFKSGSSGGSFDFNSLFNDMGVDEENLFAAFGKKLKEKAFSKKGKPVYTTHDKYDKDHNTGDSSAHYQKADSDDSGRIKNQQSSRGRRHKTDL